MHFFPSATLASVKPKERRFAGLHSLFLIDFAR